MSKYTKEEVALVLKTAELLNKKGSSEKINISQFCSEAQISRKNAYKHKKNIEDSNATLREQIEAIAKEKAQIKDKLKLAETRAKEVDLYSGCNEVLVKAIKHNKKNLNGTKRQKQLIEAYNKIADSHGLEPLNFWE